MSVKESEQMIQRHENSFFTNLIFTLRHCFFWNSTWCHRTP